MLPAVLHRNQIYNAVPAERRWNTTVFNKAHTANPSGDQSTDDWLGAKDGNEIGVSARLFSVAALAKPEYNVDLLAGAFAEVDVTLLGYRARLLRTHGTLSAGQTFIDCKHYLPLRLLWFHPGDNLESAMLRQKELFLVDSRSSVAPCHIILQISRPYLLCILMLAVP